MHSHFNNTCALRSYFCASTCWPATPIWQLFPTPKLGRRQIGMRRRSHVRLEWMNVQDKRKLHAPLITRWQLQWNHILVSSKYTNLWNAWRNQENKNANCAREGLSDWLKPCQLLIWSEGLAAALFFSYETSTTGHVDELPAEMSVGFVSRQRGKLRWALPDGWEEERCSFFLPLTMTLTAF